MKSKANPGNFFEDFKPGQRLRHAGSRTLNGGDASLYLGLTGDRHPVHCDSIFARTLGYSRERVNDMLVFHIVFGQSVADISLNAVANLGYAEVRFLEPVYPGETLHARSTVVGLKENSNGKNGNVYVRTEGIKQNGDIVLEYYRWVMVHKRDPKAKCGKAQVPELADAVSPYAFAVHDALLEKRKHKLRWPGDWFWGDYEVGERIYHGPGMTVEEAEHAIATRLYQNTARVHFDGHFMRDAGGERLIYGGHVISIAYAMAYTGFENSLGVLAWNAGTHANPTFAGDTLYAYTDVLGVEAVPKRDDVGALRLRLVAVKNHDPQAEPIDLKVTDPEKDRETYHPNVVLDLEYYLLMPVER